MYPYIDNYHYLTIKTINNSILFHSFIINQMITYINPPAKLDQVFLLLRSIFFTIFENVLSLLKCKVSSLP